VSTGYVYHPIYLEHDLPGHPENARRLERIMEVLQEDSVLDRLTALQARPATEQELTRVHTPAYVQQVRQVAEQGGGSLDPDTYVNPRSYEAARMAAGGVLAALEDVLAGRIDNGFALVRPPGHHALPSRGMGFCLFNNVAVAAHHALTFDQIERVFITDFDVHHGNGTQAVFAENPHVFYFSTHEYPFYPGTGHWREMGVGKGEGTVLDVSLPAGVGDTGYMRIYQELVWPLARRFEPDVMLVSAGYDAHWQDPLAMMRLSLTGYARLSQELVAMAGELCDGRILFTLEGGYNLDVLAHGVLNAFYALLGEGTVSDPYGAPSAPGREIEDLLHQLQELHGLEA